MMIVHVELSGRIFAGHLRDDFLASRVLGEEFRRIIHCSKKRYLISGIQILSIPLPEMMIQQSVSLLCLATSSTVNVRAPPFAGAGAEAAAAAGLAGAAPPLATSPTYSLGPC